MTMIEAALQYLHDRFVESHEPKWVSHERYHSVLLPDGKLVDLTAKAEKLADKPGRQTGRFVMYDMESLIAHNAINTTTKAAGYIDAPESISAPNFVVVYNDKGWRDFSAMYAAKFSRQWALWNEEEPMGQLEFARFLEDNAPDVLSPNVADLMKIATQFKHTSAGSLSSDITLQDGSVRLVYEDTKHTTIEVPETIDIRIPVFENDVDYRVTLRFRWRTEGAKVLFFVQVIMPERYIKDATEAMTEQFRHGVGHDGTPIYRGAAF